MLCVRKKTQKGKISHQWSHFQKVAQLGLEPMMFWCQTIVPEVCVRHRCVCMCVCIKMENHAYLLKKWNMECFIWKLKKETPSLLLSPVLKTVVNKSNWNKKSQSVTIGHKSLVCFMFIRHSNFILSLVRELKQVLDFKK